MIDDAARAARGLISDCEKKAFLHTYVWGAFVCGHSRLCIFIILSILCPARRR